MNSLKSKETTRLKPEIVKQIEDKPVLKALLAEHFRVSTFTIARWLKNNDPYLSFIEAQGIISRELGIPIAQISEVLTLTEGD